MHALPPTGRAVEMQALDVEHETQPCIGLAAQTAPAAQVVATAAKAPEEMRE